MEVLGGAAAVGTAVIAGAALGIAALAVTDFGDVFSNAADLLGGGCDGCQGCDGLLDIFGSCPF